MPTATRPLSPPPIPQIPIIDPKTGQMTAEFADYLKALDTLIRALRLEIP